eukprot:CAMPEP_0197663620 /NCGR_PEP_ID=MMETSP1338-20131121/58142_1 /TAXON_ID=43686 ORGANISM="Pelagodinium beii, Strain RCC1491" /NCGR_SAMPLE_ID=MMETSP1338 /ASSEMBLY_ACC=CAM_ASM_000754 /LENGTH=163 /DNA_ID=CAMNT_0043242093 /DNA_START=65 /DNA_END=556 /DNA_ORIENTATION=-
MATEPEPERPKLDFPNMGNLPRGGRPFTQDRYYSRTGPWQAIARHGAFKANYPIMVGLYLYFTLFNEDEENTNKVATFFSCYFAFDLMVRFLAYEQTFSAVKDAHTFFGGFIFLAVLIQFYTQSKGMLKIIQPVMAARVFSELQRWNQYRKMGINQETGIHQE